MNEVDSLLKQLNDIEGLDSISSWPLAIGWWILMGLGIAILSLAAWYLIQWIIYRRSWKYETLEKLNDLSKNLTDEKIKEAAILLSEYLRRIAMRRFSRKTCAGLRGQEWLKWLSEHDAKNFDWVNQGKLLIDAPYAPSNHGLTAEQLKRLIQAAKEWVC